MKKAIIILVVLLSACSGGSSPSSFEPRPTIGRQSHVVEYRVKGNTNAAGLTYENDGGNSEQQDIEQATTLNSRIWTKTYHGFETGDFLYLSAQNGNDSGTITCEIWVDGELAESASSTGGFVIATCSGSAE